MGSVRWSKLALSAVCATACGGERIALGSAESHPEEWSEPELVAELASEAVDDNPTLTNDLLELYFTSRRDGGQGSTDIWVARRANADAPFEAPEPIEELNTPQFESSPAISHDGLTLWFGSAREGSLGDLDIWESTRPDRNSPWSEPRHLESLNSEAADIPRPLGQGGRVMPLSSRNNEPGLYWTYLAEKDEAGEFLPPVLVEELATSEAAVVDGFLTDDGLTLWFNRTPLDGSGDIYKAVRRTLETPFEEPTLVAGINTADEERDPWLSPDGRQLYFVSDRDGVLQIYRSHAH